MVRPPARSAPKRSAAKTVPIGVARPKSATVIASNPKLPPTPAVIAGSDPRI